VGLLYEIMSSIRNRYTRYKEHGPFTTQEAAQEYKDQHLLKEEGWEVKQVSYPTKDEKRRTIWVIRHDL
jgi:hypothetical protein